MESRDPALIPEVKIEIDVAEEMPEAWLQEEHVKGLCNRLQEEHVKGLCNRLQEEHVKGLCNRLQSCVHRVFMVRSVL